MFDKQKINEDLKAAMLSHDTLKTSVLRMLKAEILKIETDGSHREIDEGIILECIKRMLKQRKDSAEQFRSGNRFELAEKEEGEMKILEAYMPEQMSQKQMEDIVRETMKELGVTDKSGMGKLMGVLMSKLKGKADGSLVKQAVEKVLA